MGSFSIWHWLIVLLVVMLLFGSGKVSNLMGDFAKGIKSFKKGLSEDEKAEDVPKVDPVKTIDHQPPSTAGTAMGSGAMVDAVAKANETYPQMANVLTPFLPNWVAEPEDIADAVCWLASDESRNVTAAAISVDQGSTQY